MEGKKEGRRLAAQLFRLRTGVESDSLGILPEHLCLPLGLNTPSSTSSPSYPSHPIFSFHPDQSHPLTQARPSLVMGKIRTLGVVLLSSLTTSLILFSFVRPPKLLSFGLGSQDDWLEYGHDGTCVCSRSSFSRSDTTSSLGHPLAPPELFPEHCLAAPSLGSFSYLTRRFTFISALPVSSL